MSRTEPVRKVFLPFSRPTLEDDEIAEVVDSLRSGWITTGPKVGRFEDLFRERLGVPHAVAVSSATAGLHILMHALGVGPGDEVVVPALTWPATANAVELLGARTVFADVDRDTLQIDPADVSRRLSARTKAVIPVHFAGAPADLDALRSLLAGTGIPIVEDAAHAAGTFYKGQEIGSDSYAAVFSFHPIKNITTGEGGMIVCRDDELARRLRLLRFHGVSKDAWKRFQGGSGPRYDILEPGYKYNMLDLQAALGLHQMPKLDRFNAQRTRLAARYDELLAGLSGLTPIGRVPYPSTHAWHLYIVRIDPGALSITRDQLLEELADENIGVGLHFLAVHLLEHYRVRHGYKPGDLPEAEAAGEEVFSLPLYPLLSEDDQRDVVEALSRVLARHRREKECVA